VKLGGITMARSLSRCLAGLASMELNDVDAPVDTNLLTSCGTGGIGLRVDFIDSLEPFT